MEPHWEIPRGWGARSLADIAPENSRQTRPADRPDVLVNYWSLDAINKDQFVEPNINLVRGSEIQSTCVEFDTSHVLYGKLRPYLNKVIVPSQPGVGSTEWVPLRPIPELLDRKYLACVLRTKLFVDYATSSSTGARMPRASKEALRIAAIPLPYPNDPPRSLAEQRRIVARLEALLGEVRELRRLQAEIEADVGRLIETARHEVFSDLAHRYPTAKFGEIADSRLGKMLSQVSKKGTDSRPYLRNANVLWGEFNLDDVFEMDFSAAERIEFALRPDDLLICEGGEIGRCAVWEGQIEECYFQKALHRARLKDRSSLSRYLMHFLAWAATNGAIANLRTGSAIPHLTGIKLKMLDVIWPEPSVQQEVVNILDGIQAELRNLNAIRDETITVVQQLEQSILAQAFRGEL